MPRVYTPSYLQQNHIGYIRIYQSPSRPRAFKIPSPPPLSLSLRPKKLPIYGFSFFNVASLKFNDLYPNVYVFFCVPIRLLLSDSASIFFLSFLLSSFLTLSYTHSLTHTRTHTQIFSLSSHFFFHSLARIVCNVI